MQEEQQLVRETARNEKRKGFFLYTDIALLFTSEGPSPSSCPGSPQGHLRSTLEDETQGQRIFAVEALGFGPAGLGFLVWALGSVLAF